MVKIKRAPRQKWSFFGYSYHLKNSYFNERLGKKMWYFKCIYDNSKIKRCNGGGVMIDNKFKESNKYRHKHSRNLKLADDTKFCQTLRLFSCLPFVKPKQVVKAWNEMNLK
ncbi:uncharacterized protein LOC141529578 [Cotesia typhae]|uniref:uncharacterized protein LOC141529578 n=1 Tax=Cotesia typhae TaxID=2053667 RepID=UPI003D696707